MSFNYAGLSASALANIDKFGRNVTHRVVTKGEYDTASGTRAADTTVNQTVKAVITDIKKSQIDGEVIQRGDKMMIVAAAAINTPPKTGHSFLDGSIEYKVVEVMDVHPGDTPLLYKMAVRK